MWLKISKWFRDVYWYVWYYTWIISPLGTLRNWVGWKLGKRKCRREGHAWQNNGGRTRICLRCTHN